MRNTRPTGLSQDKVLDTENERPSTEDKLRTRREFMRRAGKVAWVVPVVTVMGGLDTIPAQAQNTYVIECSIEVFQPDGTKVTETETETTNDGGLISKIISNLKKIMGDREPTQTPTCTTGIRG